MPLDTEMAAAVDGQEAGFVRPVVDVPPRLEQVLTTPAPDGAKASVGVVVATTTHAR